VSTVGPFLSHDKAFRRVHVYVARAFSMYVSLLVWR